MFGLSVPNIVKPTFIHSNAGIAIYISNSNYSDTVLNL